MGTAKKRHADMVSGKLQPILIKRKRRRGLKNVVFGEKWGRGISLDFLDWAGCCCMKHLA